MKNLKKVLLFFVVLFGISTVFAQKVTTQAIDKPSEGKSLVYILKTGAGALINFRIYDKDVFLGSLSSGKYLAYECEPGQHLFWAGAENRDYVEANLEPNSVYVINAEGQMGAFVAGVNLRPMNPNEFRDKKVFYQVIKNDTKQLYTKSDEDKSENIAKAMEKYQELKSRNSNKIAVLASDMKFENADKPTK
ncbi:hypothetical protein SAMN05880574_10389 [Chryseobacterium sp. RU37D]|uniref:hypothetical protein n=1 Tax=Chryseobacterium sp. RU37D TaxID=1907397 RepID=UPI000956C00B|nr:hypothetical protein [Chryseobacterium sp. RU37D]SIP97641.1 hypothetical protein SAMN05880574_10389 [Chryseobacterium sp. RU37D]